MGNLDDRLPFGEPGDVFSLEPCPERVNEATCIFFKKERLEEEVKEFEVAETRLDL